MISYEIHTFQEGKWKTDSVFDSRDLALHEAKKMIEGGRHTNLQVFEENYNEETNETTARRIFKGGAGIEDKKKPVAAGKKSAPTARRGSADKEVFQKTRRVAQPKKRASLAVPVAILSVFVAVGLAALIGLRYLS